MTISTVLKSGSQVLSKITPWLLENRPHKSSFCYTLIWFPIRPQPTENPVSRGGKSFDGFDCMAVPAASRHLGSPGCTELTGIIVRLCSPWQRLKGTWSGAGETLLVLEPLSDDNQFPLNGIASFLCSSFLFKALWFPFVLGLHSCVEDIHWLEPPALCILVCRLV